MIELFRMFVVKIIMLMQQAFINVENWIKENNQAGIKMDSVFLSHLEKGIQLKKSNWIPEKIQNTYLKEFEIPQILLFDLLTNKFPLVTACQQIAEKAFIKKASGYSELCILDIGIGRGFQMMRLLDALQEVESVQKVTLIGVEISNDALNFTLSKLQERKNNFKFELQYHMMNSPVELITYDMIEAQVPADCKCLVVNASLTLHHIQKIERKRCLYSNFIRTIRRISLRIFIII